MHVNQLRECDRAAAQRAIAARPLFPSRKLPDRAQTNWCPLCQEYQTESHSH